MKWGLLSDIHGNAVALRACLRHMDALAPDQVFFIGDAVGYFPGEQEVLSLLAERGVVCQQGNHEAMLLHPDARAAANEGAYRLRPAAARLGAAALERIAAWPTVRRIAADGVRALLVHGSPERPLDGYLNEDADWAACGAVPEDAVFFGHTHRPFVAQHGGKLLVNVGSVGLPRDQGNLGSFGVFDTRERQCRLYRFAFDADEVLRAYGESVDGSVRECLRRQSARLVGEKLDG